MKAGSVSTSTTSAVLDTEYCSHSMNESLQQAAGMVVYSSQAEKIFSLVAMVAMGIFTVVGQLFVAITITWSERLRQNPHFIMILMSCVADIWMVVSAKSLYVWQYSYGCIPILPCRLFSSGGLSIGLGIGNLIAYMALERAIYFCHPMRYEGLFTLRKMATGMSLIFSMSAIYVVATELAIGRGYHATVLGCQLPGSNGQIMMQVVLFILPAAVTTGVCMYKIWKLTRTCSVAPVAYNPATISVTQTTAAAPGPDEGNAVQEPEKASSNSSQCRQMTRGMHVATVDIGLSSSGLRQVHSPAVLPLPGLATGHPSQAIPSKQAKKAFRMIVLVSGAFWVTFLPAYVIRATIFMSGRTWVDLDTRAFPTQALMLRSGNYAYTSISSLLNPLIYFYSRRDLRQEFLRLLGIRPNNVHPY